MSYIVYHVHQVLIYITFYYDKHIRSFTVCFNNIRNKIYTKIDILKHPTNVTIDNGETKHIQKYLSFIRAKQNNIKAKLLKVSSLVSKFSFGKKRDF